MKNSRRGTANSRFLRARSRALRSTEHYRPRRNPRPSKDASLRSYWILITIIAATFSLAEIWKESRVSQLCAELDNLRSTQQELVEEYTSLQLSFDRLSAYPRIEPLARDILGMEPATKPPIVITTVDERFMAYRSKSTMRKDQ